MRTHKIEAKQKHTHIKSPHKKTINNKNSDKHTHTKNTKNKKAKKQQHNHNNTTKSPLTQTQQTS